MHLLRGLLVAVFGAGSALSACAAGHWFVVFSGVFAWQGVVFCPTELVAVWFVFALNCVVLSPLFFRGCCRRLIAFFVAFGLVFVAFAPVFVLPVAPLGDESFFLDDVVDRRVFLNPFFQALLIMVLETAGVLVVVVGGMEVGWGNREERSNTVLAW